MPDEAFPFPALRARIAQLAAEGRHEERERAAWQLAELIMRGPRSFNPWRPKVRLLRYPVIEAS